MNVAAALPNKLDGSVSGYSFPSEGWEPRERAVGNLPHAFAAPGNPFVDAIHQAAADVVGEGVEFDALEDL